MLHSVVSHLGLHCLSKYSKTCLKWPLSKRPKIGFQEQLSLNAGQSIRPSLGSHLTLRYFLSISERLLKTGFTIPFYGFLICKVSFLLTGRR